MRRVFRANGVEIDFESGRIVRDGEHLYLRQKARRVLMCLVEHRNQPVAKDELIRQVWDQTPTSDEVLTGCIREIRKALGDDARQPAFIRTMPKTGYSFVAAVDEVPAPVVEPDLPSPAPPRPRPWMVIAVGLVLVFVLAAWVFWPRSQPVVRGEVARWQMEEGALPAGVARVPGISGSALSFDGRDSVLLGSDAGTLPAGGPRTMTAWIRTGAPAADTSVFFDYQSMFLMLHQSSRAGFGTGKRFALGKSKAVNDDRWHQVAGAFEGGHARLYVDGEYEAGETIEPVSPASSQWALGRTSWGGTPYRGLLDDVRLFARALNASEIQALYRCGSGAVDLDIPGRGAHFFAPVFGMNVAISAARVRNTSADYSGVAFVRRQAGCAWQSTLASDMGQDLEIEMEIKVGGQANGPVASGGPYFRSRRSHPGDGIVGGTSAGYWVELLSTGQVRVKRLYPAATVAFSSPIERFDPEVFHALRVSVQGAALVAALDSREVVFDQAGLRGARVALPPVWETTSPKGNNQGAAGVAFACEGYRGQVGGQEARNIKVSASADPRSTAASLR